jgi:murein DD-endopeptidase MepM/ murein hydrolase activator NlpD
MRRSFWVSITLGLTAYLALPLPGEAVPRLERIEGLRGQVEQKKQREGVLTGTISTYSTRIEGLQGQISAAYGRLRRVQAELDRKQAELEEVRRRLQVVRDRLEELRALLKIAQDALADRLVELYKADEPDALTVVLEADGFADLLERTEFLDRVSDQDQRILDRVRVLKGETERKEDELAALEQQAEAAANAILARRNELAAAKDLLVDSHADLAAARGAKRAVLAKVRSTRSHLEGDLRDLEAEQARVEAALRASQAPAGLPAGPIRPGSGQFIWPVNGPITGSFGEARPGHMHAGIDISAPTGTPIRAAGAGRVVLLGFQGGYGNYTCVQHTGSLSTCYAHQSSFGTSNGASVSQGQVIGSVGCTGHCFGDHLHFEVRVGGSPVDPMGYL